jgi:hypothetical protein
VGGEGRRRLGRGGRLGAVVGVVKLEMRVDVCLAGDRLVGVRGGAERGGGVHAGVVGGIHREAVAVETLCEVQDLQARWSRLA